MTLKTILAPLIPRSLRRPLKAWLLARLGIAPITVERVVKVERVVIRDVPSDAIVLEKRLVQEAPTPQAALDIFKGVWLSKLPGEFGRYAAGTIPLFDDGRIPMGAPHFGGIEGKIALDLGPLEGGQSYVLEKMGALSVTAVEANTLLYLRCLVAKEILGMHRTRFLCGNVVEYLRTTEDRFDLCVACGILYHMVDPLELLSLIAKKSQYMLLWTHYVDPVAKERNKIAFDGQSTRDFMGRGYTYYRQEYREGFVGKTYCGGIVPHSNWMGREDLMAALGALGYRKIHTLSDEDTVSGPAILLAASRV